MNPDLRRIGALSPKLCECGCGDPAPLATKTDSRYGAVKGQPLRFIYRHHIRLRRGVNVGGTTKERFGRKVVRGAPDDCWEWPGTKNHRGYGVIHVFGATRRVFAHRVAWEIECGRPIPPGLSVCHRCDNPACVNPAHLFLGTQAENMADMRRKGRHVLPPRKLTIDHVRAIRASTEPYAVVAERFGISENHVWQIRAGRYWRDA